MTIKISQKGWVVIPAELRKKYNLVPGAEVIFVDYGGILAIFPAMKDPIKQAAGMLKGDPSLTEALINERRQEYQREQHNLTNHDDHS
jgi:AbrB family looped-hinge helix DNA binding protein